MATPRRARDSAPDAPQTGASTPAADESPTPPDSPTAARVPAEGEPVHEDDAGGTQTVELDQGGQPPTAFYTAQRPLPVGDEMGGEAGLVVAFAEGDLVPAAHVERFSWHAHVTRPDGLPVDAPGQDSAEAPAGAASPPGGPAPFTAAQQQQSQLAEPVPQVAAPDNAPTTAQTGGEES